MRLKSTNRNARFLHADIPRKLIQYTVNKKVTLLNLSLVEILYDQTTRNIKK